MEIGEQFQLGTAGSTGQQMAVWQTAAEKDMGVPREEEGSHVGTLND